MKNRYFASSIGLVMLLPGILSFLSNSFPLFASLMFIPILSLLPLALPLEVIGKKLFENYSDSSFFVVMVLLLLLILSIIHLLRIMKKNNYTLSKVKICLFFVAQFFIVHPLVFYIWAYKTPGAASDGQFIFGTLNTFSISSLIIFLMGYAIDFLLNRKLKLH